MCLPTCKSLEVSFLNTVRGGGCSTGPPLRQQINATIGKESKKASQAAVLLSGTEGVPTIHRNTFIYGKLLNQSLKSCSKSSVSESMLFSPAEKLFIPSAVPQSGHGWIGGFVADTSSRRPRSLPSVNCIVWHDNDRCVVSTRTAPRGATSTTETSISIAGRSASVRIATLGREPAERTPSADPNGHCPLKPLLKCRFCQQGKGGGSAQECHQQQARHLEVRMA